MPKARRDHARNAERRTSAGVPREHRTAPSPRPTSASPSMCEEDEAPRVLRRHPEPCRKPNDDRAATSARSPTLNSRRTSPYAPPVKMPGQGPTTASPHDVFHDAGPVITERRRGPAGGRCRQLMLPPPMIEHARCRMVMRNAMHPQFGVHRSPVCARVRLSPTLLRVATASDCVSC